ncbi:hypothetical protein M3Y96_00537800 [Aphelenchoides besseyi]|nr:hypothetical protein M3Y96_00537800 [Aphelenchoides besseyi]
MSHRRRLLYGNSANATNDDGPTTSKRLKMIDVEYDNTDSNTNNENRLDNHESEAVCIETKPDDQFVNVDSNNEPQLVDGGNVFWSHIRELVSDEEPTNYLHRIIGSSNYLIVDLNQLENAKKLTGPSRTLAMLKSIYNDGTTAFRQLETRAYEYKQPPTGCLSESSKWLRERRDVLSMIQLANFNTGHWKEMVYNSFRIEFILHDNKHMFTPDGYSASAGAWHGRYAHLPKFITYDDEELKQVFQLVYNALTNPCVVEPFNGWKCHKCTCRFTTRYLWAQHLEGVHSVEIDVIVEDVSASRWLMYKSRIVSAGFSQKRIIIDGKWGQRFAKQDPNSSTGQLMVFTGFDKKTGEPTTTPYDPAANADENVKTYQARLKSAGFFLRQIVLDGSKVRRFVKQDPNSSTGQLMVFTGFDKKTGEPITTPYDPAANADENVKTYQARLKSAGFFLRQIVLDGSKVRRFVKQDPNSSTGQLLVYTGTDKKTGEFQTTPYDT